MSGIAVRDRKRYLGASEIGAVMGHSGFRTPLDVWNDKKGLGTPEDLSGKLNVQSGNAFESGIIWLFNKPEIQRDNGLKTWTITPAEKAFWVHPNNDRMSASPDAYAVCKEREGEALMDIKFSSGYGFTKDGKEEYHWQLMHQMACAPRYFDYGVLGVYMHKPTLKLMEYFYERDEDMMYQCEVVTEKFWKSIDEDIPPPAHDPYFYLR